MDGHLGGHGGGVALAAAMWLGMVVVMMTPTVLPWLRAYATLAAPAPAPASQSWRASAIFGSGYFAVWVAYSLAMAALQVALARAGVLAGDRLAASAGALVLVAAGAYQFAPLKAACLTHCRNSLTYFLACWRDGPVGGFRMGVAHGWFCLGCCWAVMLTALAIGAMHLGWMAVLTAVIVAEQRWASGVVAGRVFGVVLIGWGLWRLA